MTHAPKIFPAYTVLGAGDLQTALLLDSPHSGSAFPDDHKVICPKIWLQQTEDTYVDELFAGAFVHGIPLLKGHFSRAYVDVNRAADDIAADLVDGVYPKPINPTERSDVGQGVLRSLCRGKPIYQTPFPVPVIQARLENCHAPYHAMLTALCNQIYAKHKRLWHINCHSMPSTDGLGTFAARFAKPHADFVLGDRDGTSCAPEFVDVIAEFLRGKGYRVCINDPYKGVEILRKVGRPEQNRHSLQIEINRKLYMDEETLEKKASFIPLQEIMGEMLGVLKEWTASQRADIQKQAAE